MPAFLSNLYFVHAMAAVATLLFAVIILIQLLIGLGVLPITIAWGGRQRKLTPQLRIASFAAAVILVLFIYLIRYRAGLVNHPIPGWIRVAAWAIVGFMAFNAVGNAASQSRIERFLFTPITLVLALACFVVAASRLN